VNDVDQLWAVVPVAGFGARLRPHTHTRPKPLLHVAGKPIIGHILDQLVPLGIKKIVLVVGYLGDRIVDYVKDRGDFTEVEFVEQKEMLGLGHAIWLTRDLVGEDPQLMVYGDTIFQADLADVLSRPGDGHLGVKRVDDPSRFGVVLQEGDRVTGLVEKPDTFVSDLAIVGVNHIRDSRRLYACLGSLIREDRRTRNEFQVTDAFQTMVDEGADIGTFVVKKWYDCGTREALLLTNREMLEGRDVPEARDNVVVVPPAHIDPTAVVSHSVIGPHASVGAGARVRQSVIRNSIVGEEAVVENIVLEDSIIGFQAAVKGRPSNLSVGDLSQITS
jgi:glucose-1-phosphate thymidylyltransferase